MLLSTTTQHLPVAHFGNALPNASNHKETYTGKDLSFPIQTDKINLKTTNTKGDLPPTLNQKSFWDAPTIEFSDEYASGASVVPISQGGNAMRHLYMQQMLHPERLHLSLNNIYETTQIFGFYPALSLMPKPLDVVLKSISSKTGLCALTHPNVRSFMTPEASIIFESVKNSSSKHRRSTELQIDRWLEKITHENLATQVLDKIGNYDREKLITMFKARDGIKTLSSLEALALGDKGAIDGIIVGNPERVVTRKDLDAFLKHKKEKEGWTKKQVDHFLQDAFRIHEIPSHPLKEVFPESVPGQENQNFKKPELYERPINAKKFSYGKQQPEKALELPKQCQLVDSIRQDAPALILKNIQDPMPTILNKNTIFFTDRVDKDSIGNCVKALKRLDQSNQASGSKNHISLIINSPGGSAPYAKVFVDAINYLKTPVDAIVANTAASAGSMFLTLAATGKRFALPSALMMIHEASLVGSHVDAGDDGKKLVESLQRNISNKTGRPINDVRKDMLNDYWVNALEALFYGEKGMIDGIIVGPRHVVTRKEVMEYLKEKLGSEEAVNKKINERLERRRDMHKELDHDFNPNDPFDNLVQTFKDVAKRKTRILGEDPEFLHCGPDLTAKIIEHVPIKPFKRF